MILALKTADFTTQIWLFPDAPSNQHLANLEWESGRALSDQLLARITQLLQDHSSQLTDLTGIVIFSGPGSFTSLRIGHTVANALADSLDIPVIGAKGDDWLSTGRDQIPTTQPGQPAMPHYGSEAHITKSETHRRGRKS